MTRSGLIAIVGLGLLCGCAPQLAAENGAALAAARQQCDTTYPKIIGLYGSHAKCLNGAIERIALPTSRNPDLVKLQEAARVVLSTKIDRKEMSPEDAGLQMAELDTRVASIAHSRLIEDKNAAANELATTSTWLAAFQQSLPRTTSCMGNGSVNCISR
jgi:N-formylglutamate amidohydrolase